MPDLAEVVCLPGADAHFVTLLGVFRLADPARAETPESPAPCSSTVATVYPLGNCDWPKPETSLSYLTQLGTVSHRSSPPSSYFALLTARERRQRNW